MLDSIKKIKVMPEFESTGIWDYETDEMLDLLVLDLSENLIHTLDSWTEFYEECFVNNGTYDTMIPDKCLELNSRGLEIAKRIKVLYPNIEVVYMGEDEKGVHPLITV